MAPAVHCGKGPRDVGDHGKASQAPSERGLGKPRGGSTPPQRKPCQGLQRAAPFTDTSRQTASWVLRANTCPSATTGVVQHLPGNTSARTTSS